MAIDNERLTYLRQVAMIFSMAIGHYEDYLMLSKMGQMDSMTGLMNRNSYHKHIETLLRKKPETLGCIYSDVNGLHELNNYLGHQVGDEMLKTVAFVLRKQFEGEKIFRIGGDEFVILCQNWDKQKMQDQIERAKEELKASGYEISVGISWKTGSYSINELINEAEDEMRQNKQEFYEKGGKERNFRCLNHKMEELIASKKEADVILSVLQPGFGGVYFVNLDQDTLRHVFIPEYFREIVEECKGVFSKSLLEYGKRMVVEEYYSQFEQVCNYDWLKKQLMQGKQPSETSSSTTLWIFENK